MGLTVGRNGAKIGQQQAQDNTRGLSRAQSGARHSLATVPDRPNSITRATSIFQPNPEPVLNLGTRADLKKLVGVFTCMVGKTREVKAEAKSNIETFLLSESDSDLTHKDIALVENYLKAIERARSNKQEQQNISTQLDNEYGNLQEEYGDSQKEIETLIKQAAVLSDDTQASEFDDALLLKKVCKYSAKSVIHDEQKINEFIRDTLIQLRALKSVIARNEMKNAIKEKFCDFQGANLTTDFKGGIRVGVSKVGVGAAASKGKYAQMFLDGNLYLVGQQRVEGKLGLMSIFNARATAGIKIKGKVFRNIDEIADYLVDRPKKLRVLFPDLYKNSVWKQGKYRHYARDQHAAAGAHDQSRLALETMLISQEIKHSATLSIPRSEQAHGVERVKIKSGVHAADAGIGASFGVAALKGVLGWGWGRHRQTNIQYGELQYAFADDKTRKAILGSKHTKFNQDLEKIQTAVNGEETNASKLVLSNFKLNCSNKLSELEKDVHEYQHALNQQAQYLHPLFNKHIRLRRVLPRRLLTYGVNNIAHKTKREIERKYGVKGRVMLMRTLEIDFLQNKFLLECLPGINDDPELKLPQRAKDFHQKIYQWQYERKYFNRIQKYLYSPRFIAEADVYGANKSLEATIGLGQSRVAVKINHRQKLKAQTKDSHYKGNYDVDFLRVSCSAEVLSQLSALPDEKPFVVFVQSIFQALFNSPKVQNSELYSNFISAIPAVAREAASYDGIKNSAGVTCERGRVHIEFADRGKEHIEFADRGREHIEFADKSDRDWLHRDKHLLNRRGPLAWFRKVTGKQARNWQDNYLRVYADSGLTVGGEIPVDGQIVDLGVSLAAKRTKTNTRVELWLPNTLDAGGDRVRALSYQNPYLAWQWLYFQQHGKFAASCPDFDFGKQHEKISGKAAQTILPYIELNPPKTITKLWENIAYMEGFESQYNPDQIEKENALPTAYKGKDQYLSPEELKKYSLGQDENSVYVWANDQKDVRHEAFTKFRAIDELELESQQSASSKVRDTDLLSNLFGSDDQPIHVYLSQLRQGFKTLMTEVPNFDNNEGLQECSVVRYKKVGKKNGGAIVEYGRVLAKRYVETRTMGYFERLGRAVAEAADNPSISEETKINALYFLLLAKAVHHKTSPAGLAVGFGA